MDHPENDAQYAGLAVNKGIEQPPIVNPYLKKMRTAKRRSFTASEYVEGIVKGDTSIPVSYTHLTLPTTERV